MAIKTIKWGIAGAVAVAALVSAACSSSGSSPTAASSTTTTAAAPAAAAPAPAPVVALVGSVTITNTPSPAPYSGLPINDAASCKGSPNTWFYTQTLKETGGLAVTFTSRIDTFDQRVVNNTSGLSLVVPANGSLDIASRWCSSEAVTHTAQSSFSGTDSAGHAIKVDGPVITLKSP
jgi:hypothetical protein